MTIERPERERYTHGYHEAIVSTYARRTAEECAAFLLPHLRADAVVLDVGSGPGTITAGLARRVGRVIGIDTSEEMVDTGRSLVKDHGIDNATFRLGSAYDLPWRDSYFDVVYAHQLLQHLAEPVRALREARRVLKTGGPLAVRDADYETNGVSPKIRLSSGYHKVTAANGPRPTRRFLLFWVLGARFVDLNTRPSLNR